MPLPTKQKHNVQPLHGGHRPRTPSPRLLPAALGHALHEVPAADGGHQSCPSGSPTISLMNRTAQRLYLSPCPSCQREIPRRPRHTHSLHLSMSLRETRASLSDVCVPLGSLAQVGSPRMGGWAVPRGAGSRPASFRWDWGPALGLSELHPPHL